MSQDLLITSYRNGLLSFLMIATSYWPEYAFATQSTLHLFTIVHLLNCSSHTPHKNPAGRTHRKRAGWGKPPGEVLVSVLRAACALQLSQPRTLATHLRSSFALDEDSKARYECRSSTIVAKETQCGDVCRSTNVLVKVDSKAATVEQCRGTNRRATAET